MQPVVFMPLMFTCCSPLTLASILFPLLLSGYHFHWLLLGGCGQTPDGPTEGPRKAHKPTTQASANIFDDLRVASTSHFAPMQKENRTGAGPAVTADLPNVSTDDTLPLGSPLDKKEAADSKATGRRTFLTTML